MQLYYTPMSPYARKVLMLAKLLQQELELVHVSPLKDEQIRSVNPLGKVPALVDGDLTLLDSTLICEYLDDKSDAGGGISYLRRNTPQYYVVQNAQALANGILDAALATVMELRRNDAEHSAFWLERWHLAMVRAIESIDVANLGDSEQVHMGTIATISALGYLDFRLPPLKWRESNPPLAQWYDAMEQLEWVRDTAPQDQ